jgi:tripartite-type tricarboxylate transporter receptor subunit TctC
MLPKSASLLLATAVAAALAGLGCADAFAQAPKTIRIIVPIAAGGADDFVSRLLADQVSRMQGVSTVVENRPGAGTVIGTEAASRAAPDGGTLMITDSSFVVSPNLRKLAFDPFTDFAPICVLARVPMIIAVNSSSPFASFADFIAEARAKPGDLTIAGTGPATVFHIGVEKLKRVAKVDLTFVPYSGGGPVLNALLGDHVSAMLNSYATASGQLQAGKLRALAAAMHQRIDALPQVPTVAEFGYGDYNVDFWVGLFAPAKTPKDITAQIEGWFKAAIVAPEVQGKLKIQGLNPVMICGNDFAALIRQQYEEYGSLIREAKITAE